MAQKPPEGAGGWGSSPWAGSLAAVGQWLAGPTADGDLAALAKTLGLRPAVLAGLRLGTGPYHYRCHTIAKRDGRRRVLHVPSPALKDLQRRLVTHYLRTLASHPAATAFAPQCSIVHHARRHRGQVWLITADLVDFFTHTQAGRVRGFWASQGFHGRALDVLMRLTVQGGGLPQGAPTSPYLSNLVNVDLDNALEALAQTAGGRYSRYGDDLAFSFPKDWSPARDLPAFETALGQGVQAVGYTLQRHKGLRVQRLSRGALITGVVMDQRGRLRPPPSMGRRIRWLRFCQWWRPNPTRAARLRGYRGFVKQWSRGIIKNR
ncbi:MAG: reverse transcriptase family protein [Candidatus Competibacterales bacterium]